MNYVVIDVVTSCLSPKRGDRIIEFGAIALEAGVVTEEFYRLVDPGGPITKKVQVINGVTPSMLKGQPAPDDVYLRLSRIIKGLVLVAHNARFDMIFLHHAFHHFGLPISNRRRCTLQFSRELYPYLPDHKLETVYHHLFGNMDKNISRHRAMEDAWLTTRVWQKMTQKTLFYSEIDGGKNLG